MSEHTEHQTPAREPERAPLSEQRKSALLRYMAILFGVAFLLVLLSFLIQMRDSRETISDLNQSNASALQNALALQDQNQALTARTEELQDQLDEALAAAAQADELQQRLDAMDDDVAELRGQLTRAGDRLTDAQRAFDLLLTAEAALDAGDPEALKAALSDLAPLKDSLTPAAQARYDVLAGSLTTES